jgi:heme oxygenase (biliverdin-producing, ferredoxin)
VTTRTDPTAGTSGFSTTLRAGTRAAHESAERRPFADDLVHGRIDRAGYAAMLGQLYFVYDRLEQAADAMADDDQAAPFITPELHRRAALQSDLARLLGDDWPTRLVALPATAAYCARLDAVAFDWPGGFVAHHYTRYLGDLSGGQVIGQMAERTYGLTDEGTRFYRFDGITDPKAFKGGYRRALDEAPWDADERRRIIDEATTAFELNSRLFDELADANRRDRRDRRGR